MAGCKKCNETPKFGRLIKCPGCYGIVCERCATRRYGNWFCSSSCAEIYFFGHEDEQEPD